MTAAHAESSVCANVIAGAVAFYFYLGPDRVKARKGGITDGKG
jgi:hypothetical protein